MLFLQIILGLVLTALLAVFYKYYYLVRAERAYFAKQGLKMTPFNFWHGDRPEVGKYAKEGRQMQHAADLRDELKAKTYMMSFGPINRINVLDTNVLRQVFKSKQKHFHKSPMTASLLEPLLGMQGLFLMELPEHKKYRSLINSAFHFENLGSMVSIMVDACKRQFPAWRQEMLDQIAEGNSGMTGFGKKEMHQAWNGLGLEIVVGSVLGANFEDEETQSVMYTTFNTLVAAILKRFLNMTSVLPIIRDLPLESKKFVDAGVKRARSVVAKIIKLRKEGKSKALCKGDDLLDILLRVKDEATGKPALTEEQILDQTMTFVFAGHEPTSNLLTWAIWCLAKHPECKAKLYKEIDEVLGKEPPAYEKIGKKSMPYMNAFLNEVLRLYPPAPFIRRKAWETVDVKFGDGKLTIPKGTEIYTNFFAIQRDPDYWKDPLVFNPERFIEGELGVRKAWYPFGLGSRICIGMNYAMIESKIMFSMFLQNFEVEEVPNQPFKVDMKITMHPRGGVQAFLKPRDLPNEYFHFEKNEDSVSVSHK